MINGCVRGQDDCGCDCHRVPGVVHCFPCCDKPPARRWRKEESALDLLLAIQKGKRKKTEYPQDEHFENLGEQDPGFLQGRDPGDESAAQ